MQSCTVGRGLLVLRKCNVSWVGQGQLIGENMSMLDGLTCTDILWKFESILLVFIHCSWGNVSVTYFIYIYLNKIYNYRVSRAHLSIVRTILMILRGTENKAVDS